MNIASRHHGDSKFLYALFCIHNCSNGVFERFCCTLSHYFTFFHTFRPQFNGVLVRFYYELYAVYTVWAGHGNHLTVLTTIYSGTRLVRAVFLYSIYGAYGMNKQDAYKLVNELLASRIYSRDKLNQLAYDRGLLIGLLVQAMHNDSSMVGEVRRRIRLNRAQDR